MASGFNLTAQINLRGPSNIPQIVGDIRRQLGSINANINFRLDPNAARNVTQLNANLQNFNRTLAQTAASSNNAANAIRNLSNAINRVNSGNLAQSLNAASSATTRVSQSMTSVSRSVSSASSEMVEFGKQSGLAIRRFAAFSTVTGVVYGVTNAINQGVKAYIEYDRELVKLQQVTGQSAQGLQSLEKTITNLATNLGVGSSELTQISSTLAQAGLSARDTERALKALALSSLAPSFDSMNETVEGSIALMRQFGIGAGDLEKALGSVNSVAAKFAVEAADLITAIQRTGGVFATASKGVSEGTDALNEFLAVFTSVRATTRESAETIATGLRTIFTRIQREDTINALKEYGVNLTDLDGKFVGAYKAVESLSQGLSRLDPRDLKFSRIVEELGGFRQIGKVIPLIQQFATAQDALKVAQSGQGSLAADAAKAQESLAIQTSKVREEFLALFREIGKSDSFQTIVKGALSVTSALIKTADSIKGVLPILGVMLAFKGASAITQFGSGFVQGVRGSGGARGLGQRFAGGRSEGGEIRFATGGLVPGTGDGDTVKAKLTPGEFVMRKSAVQSIGVGNLSRMNRGGRTSKFDKGGPVPVSSLLTRSGASSIKNAVGATNLELDDTVSINIIPRQVPLNQTDFLNIWLRGNASAKKGTGQFTNYAGINISQENRNRLRNLAGKSRQEQREIKRGYGANISQQVSMLQSAEGRWGIAYEEFLINKLRANWTKASSKINYPIDLVQKLANNSIKRIGEVKFRTTPTDDIDLISKLLRYRIERGSINRYFRENQKIPRDLDKNIGSLDYFWAGNYKKEFYKFIEERQRIQSPGFVSSSASVGVPIKNFMAGSPGGVKEAEITPGQLALQNASTSEIIRVLGAQKAAKAAGVSVAEVNQLIRSKDPAKQALRDAIDKEYIKAINRKAGGAKRQENRLSAQGLVVAGAGMFGSTFDTTEEIVSPLLSSSPKVRMIGGVLNPKLAAKFDKQFGKASTRIANRASKKAMIYDVLDQLGMGRELNLDFDRTLAFGADKILSDPRTPAFSEFSDPNKVAAALQKAKLSSLGRELVKLVAAKPDLLPAMRVVTARPQSTLGLVQQWLSQKGLPIPLSQFKGFGGPNVNATNIANLKAAFLNPNSLFVDDDPRNIAAADARGDVRTYQYGAKLSKPNINTDSTIQGGLLEKVIQNLGGPGALKGLGFDFPNGLQGAAKYFGLPSDIPTDVKRTINGPSTIKDNIVTYLRNVMGYADGGLVPAMVSNGEAYIPPELAKKIGYNKLNRMNRADSNGMKAFAGGGISVFNGPGTGTSDSIGPIGLPVGSFILRQKATEALGLYAGGSVQGFASGSTVLPARPANPTIENVRIPDNVLQNLRLIAKALTDVGLASSSSALLLRKNANVTYREAERVIEADIRRMRVAGMSIENITAAETQLRETRRQGARSILTRQRFDGVSGDQLQRIEASAQASRSLAIQRARASGMTNDEINEQGFQTRLTNTAYRQATLNVTGNAAGAGVSGNSIQQYIRQSMMDRSTLAQMDRQYVAQRRQEIFNQLRAEQGVTATKGQIRQAATQALVLAEQEVKERRQILNQLAVNNGIAGPGRAGYTGGGLSGAAWRSAFGGVLGKAAAIPGNIYGNIRDTIRSQGLLGAGITGIGSGIRGTTRGLGRLGGSLAGQGGFFLSMGVGMLAGQGENIANTMGGDKRTKAGRGAAIEAGLGTVGAGLSLASGLAMIPGIGAPAAALALVATAGLAVKESFDASAKAMRDFDKSVRENKINDLNDKIAKDLETFNKTGNARDLMNSAGQLGKLSRENLLVNARDAAAEKAKSQGFFSYMMGEAKPILTVEDYRALGKNAAKDNEAAAQAVRATVEKQIQSGRDFNDIARDPGFRQIADDISMADASFMTFVAELKDGTQAERDKKIENELARRRIALMGDAAFVAANKTAIAARAMEEANKSAIELKQTFESMLRSFDQAIGRFQFEINRSDRMRESINEDLVGKSSVGKVRSRDLNILENPQAYDETTRRATSARVSRQMIGPDRQGLSADERNRRQKEATLIEQALSTDPVALSDRLIGSIKLAPSSGKTFDQVAATASGNLDNIMNAQGIPAVIQSVIKRQVNAIIQNISQNNSTDPQKIEEFNQQIQNTLGDGKMVEPLKQMALGFLKAKEELDTFSESVNRSNELQSNANRLRSEARDIRIQSDMALTQALIGAPASLSTRRSISNSNISGLTGGLTDPTGIRRNIEGLTARKAILDKQLVEGKDSDQNTIGLEIEIGRLSSQINNNKEALDTLASSTDLASAAMEQLQTAQRMQANRLQTIDQILSSTPEELEKFNKSLIRTTQRSQGINPGPSREAIKAFNETLFSTGGNVFAARRAGQAQMAQDRATDLQTMEQYKDTFILNMTNQGFSLQEAILNYERKAANVRGQMMMEAGLGGVPGMAQGIMSTINPMGDRLAREAAEEAARANNLQARAKEEQALLNSITAITTFEAAVKKATEGFAVLQDLFARMQRETADNINNTGKPTAAPAPAQPFPFNRPPVTRSSGGVIYASSGRMVNFEPKGTDTVPAMLTPGEFVVNARSTSQHLPLLKAINSGVGGYSSGGIVYLEGGGRAGAPTGSNSRGEYLLNKYGQIDWSDSEQMKIYQRLNAKDKEAWERAERSEFRNSLARSGRSAEEIRISTEKEIKDRVRRDRKQAETDKFLGIDTRNIDRDIYTDGSGGFSYSGSSSARVSIEEQKNRRRIKGIASNYTFTARGPDGKYYTQSAIIDSLDLDSGTVRFINIDPNTGSSLTGKKTKPVPFDMLDTKSQSLVLDWAKRNLAESVFTDNTGAFDTIGKVVSMDYDSQTVGLFSMNPRRQNSGVQLVQFDRLNEDSLNRAKLAIPDKRMEGMGIEDVNIGSPTLDKEALKPQMLRNRMFGDEIPSIDQLMESIPQEQINKAATLYVSDAIKKMNEEDNRRSQEFDDRLNKRNKEGQRLSGRMRNMRDLPRITPVDIATAGYFKTLGLNTDDKTVRNSLLSFFGNLLADPDNFIPFAPAAQRSATALAKTPGLSTKFGRISNAAASLLEFNYNPVEILKKIKSSLPTLEQLRTPAPTRMVPRWDPEAMMEYAAELVREKARQGSRLSLIDDGVQSARRAGAQFAQNSMEQMSQFPERFLDGFDLGDEPAKYIQEALIDPAEVAQALRSFIVRKAKALTSYEQAKKVASQARSVLVPRPEPVVDITRPFIDIEPSLNNVVNVVDDVVKKVVSSSSPQKTVDTILKTDIPAKGFSKFLHNFLIPYISAAGVGSSSIALANFFSPLNSLLNPQNKQSGGIIYASNGTLVPYEPRGTDTVPAMLTPGEFVINRAATQKHLPLLHAINSGAMSSGGVVYASDGALIPDGKISDPYTTRLSDTAVYNNISQPILRSFNLLNDQKSKLNNTSNDTKFIKDKVPSLLTSKEFKDENTRIFNSISRSSGGVVYASNGTLVNYQPRGTDTVPAMLTPGEFVVNAKSTAQHLPLLKSINSGAMSDGGVVYADGGMEIPHKNQLMQKEFDRIAKRENGELIEIIFPGREHPFNKNSIGESQHKRIWVVNSRNLDIKKLTPDNQIWTVRPYRGDPHPEIKPEHKHYWSWDGDSFPSGDRRVPVDPTGNRQSLDDWVYTPEDIPGWKEKNPNYFRDKNPYGLFPEDVRMPPWGRKPLPSYFNYKDAIIKEAIPALSHGGVVYAADGGWLDELIRGNDYIDMNNLPIGNKRIISQRPIKGLTQQWEDNPTWSNFLFRSLLPISEPSQKTTYSDGSSQINMGGGPSSRELAKHLPFDIGLKAGAKAAMSARLPQTSRFGGGLSTANTKSAAQEAFEEFFLRSRAAPRARLNPSQGSSKALYHATNTGMEDSVLRSFQKMGGRSNIAQGYGQGQGLYMYTSKEAAIRHAKSLIEKTTMSGADIRGNPMVVKFEEILDPKTFDLDYELNAGYVTRWLYDHFDDIQNILSDQKIPMLLGKGLNPVTGAKGVRTRVATNQGTSTLDSLLQSVTGKAPLRWVYDTIDSITRDGEVLSRIMAAVGKRNPDLLQRFRQEFFETMPDGAAIKYIGSDNIMPSSIDILNKARGGIVYASNGTLVNYEPRGTDTVPAMLTPGEFVVNRAATQKHLPLLHAINSGAMSDGGVVYAQNGRLIEKRKAKESVQRWKGMQIDRPLSMDNRSFNAWFSDLGDGLESYDPNNPARPNAKKNSYGDWPKSWRLDRAVARTIQEARKKFKDAGAVGAPITADQLFQKNKQTTLKQSDVETVIRETKEQQRIRDISTFNTNVNVQNKADQIIKDIKNQPDLASAVKRTDSIVSKAKFRYDYLTEGLNNINVGTTILQKGVLEDGLQEAKLWLINQKNGVEDERKSISNVFNTVANQFLNSNPIANDKDAQFLKQYVPRKILQTRGSPPAQGFSAPVDPSYFTRGGMVYAQDGGSIPSLSTKEKARLRAIESIPPNSRSIEQNKFISDHKEDENMYDLNDLRAEYRRLNNIEYRSASEEAKRQDLRKTLQGPDVPRQITPGGFIGPDHKDSPQGRINRRMNILKKPDPVPGVPSLYKGGIVYAANGALMTAQQSGSDSVPAMLTPGEFVVNREASQKYMPVLNAINKGYYNQGGIVQYLADGGIVAPHYHDRGGLSTSLSMGSNSTSISNIDTSVIKDLSDSISELKETFGSLENVKSFGQTLQQATSAMGQHIATFGENISNIPQQVMHDITATVTQHVLGINGAEERYAQQFDSKMHQVAQQHTASIVSNLHKSSEGAITNGNTANIIGRQGGIS